MDRNLKTAIPRSISQQVVANALATVADEMATTIFRTAHSTVVRDAMDFSAALCSPVGETIAQAVTIPLHLGSIPRAMSALLEKFGTNFAAGDVFIMNDPFAGGGHTPDIYVVKPAFFEGTLVGFAITVAHHADIGGRVPGTSACENTDIFQEGLRFPWIRLYAAGNPVNDLLDVIRTNVRIPRMTMGDLNAQIAACNVGQSGLEELAARYGNAPLHELMEMLLDHTERVVRADVATWPDGSAEFTDYLDSDGIDVCDVPINVKVTITGDKVIADFSKSSPMVRGALNSTKSTTEASVYCAIMSAVKSDIPYTSGAFRPIEVITKPGTITHVVTPGPSSMRGVTAFRIVDAVNGALAQLIPDRVAAAGEGGNTLAVFAGQNDDEPFVYFELVAGAWGGGPTNNGSDGLCNPCGGAANIPVEFAEAEFPIFIECYGLVPDSGGAGKSRGGLAVERAWRPLVPVVLHVRSDRYNHAPYGLRGGNSGTASRNRIRRSNSAADELLGPMFSLQLAAGDLYHHVIAGAGGWGDPLDHDPISLAADVANGKVSVKAALDEYGVAFNEAGAVDIEATNARRGKLRAALQAGAASNNQFG